MTELERDRLKYLETVCSDPDFYRLEPQGRADAMKRELAQLREKAAG